MTSGLVGDTSITSTYYLGSGEYRFWAGNDGRTEVTPAGKVRSRWNNYAVLKASRQRPVNKWICTRPDGSTFIDEPAVSFIPGQSSIPGNLELEAQSKLVDKIRGHSFNLAVNAAQSRQLVDMVVSNLGKLGRGILALKRGDFSTAARALGASPRVSKLKPSDISGRWLELQYGWLPTLSDTYEAAKAYERLTGKERMVTYRASASSYEELEMSASPAFYSAKMQVKYRVSIHAELLESLSAARSLGLLDPLSVAWEVVPYSFVVDWFVPIGAYLDNLSVLPSLTGRFSTTRSSLTFGMTPYHCLVSMPGVFAGALCTAVRYEGKDVCRGVYSSRVITSGLSPALPKFDSSGLHGKRIWNALALAYQRFH